MSKDKFPIIRAMTLQVLTYLFLCSSFWGRFDAMIAVMLFLAAMTCNILVMMTKCPNCNTSLLKTASGWWTPITSTHCRTCGYSNNPPLSGEDDTKKTPLSSRRHWSVLVASLLFGALALDIIFIFITGNDDNTSLSILIPFLAYIFSISIWLYAAYNNNSIFHIIGKICGWLASVFTAILVIGLLWSGMYGQIIVLLIFANILWAMTNSSNKELPSEKIEDEIGGTN